MATKIYESTKKFLGQKVAKFCTGIISMIPQLNIFDNVRSPLSSFDYMVYVDTEKCEGPNFHVSSGKYDIEIDILDKELIAINGNPLIPDTLPNEVEELYERATSWMDIQTSNPTMCGYTNQEMLVAAWNRHHPNEIIQENMKLDFGDFKLDFGDFPY